MSDLRPYSRLQRDTPLTGGARFIRGFRRIGTVLAAIVLLIGIPASIISAIGAQRTAEGRFAQAACINDRIRNNYPIKMRVYDAQTIDFDASGCGTGPFYAETLSHVLPYSRNPPAPLEYAIEPFTYGTAASMAGAAFLFFGFWLLGWLFAGFTRD